MKVTLSVGTTITRPMCAVPSDMEVARATRTTIPRSTLAATVVDSQECLKV